jgi:peptidoglycan-associated lipoprotein
MAAILTVTACKKKVTPAPAPAPPPPAAPTAMISANPATIPAGESTTLTWQATNATEVTISGVGAVSASGTKVVTPANSATYQLTAKGPGGTQEASARVTVTPRPQAPPPAGPSEAQLFAQHVHDIYFNYDKYDLRADQSATAKADAQWLAAHPNVRFTIEGHCDERGSGEYNIALGDNRATAVKKALVEAGVAADRIKTVSYGKERPFCTESNEACWQQNRRAHFAYGQ